MYCFGLSNGSSILEWLFEHAGITHDMGILSHEHFQCRYPTIKGRRTPEGKTHSKWNTSASEWSLSRLKVRARWWSWFTYPRPSAISCYKIDCVLKDLARQAASPDVGSCKVPWRWSTTIRRIRSIFFPTSERACDRLRLLIEVIRLPLSHGDFSWQYRSLFPGQLFWARVCPSFLVAMADSRTFL